MAQFLEERQIGGLAKAEGMPAFIKTTFWKNCNKTK